MGSNSSIQWTDHTWNPWHGCTKVSAGCKFCYMYRDKERYGQDPTKVVRSSTTFRAPLKNGKDRWPDGARVFTCSWSDWFIEEADAWRDEAWSIIKARPGLTFQILTKRPERIAAHLPADWGDGYPNVWLGVSVEDQKAAQERMPILCDVPAALRFLSVEPLLGPVHFEAAGLDLSHVEWVIVGGESGAKDRARMCHVEWISSVVAECQLADVPVFVKQLGSRPMYYETHRGDRAAMSVPGIRDSHGGEPSEWLPSLRVREFPAEAKAPEGAG